MGIFDNGTGNLGIGDAVSQLSNAAAAAFGLSSGTSVSAYSPQPYPWQAAGSASTFTPVNSPFFPYINIDPNRWNELFPYRLVVVDTSDNNNVVGTNGSGVITVLQSSGQQQGSSTIIFNPLGYYWSYNLPITPQQLNIADQFAINTTATLRGILEEHSGVRFKLITASGTMGEWPYRESVAKPPGSPSIIQSVLGGTLNAATSLINQAAAVVNTFTTNSPNNKPTTISPTSAGASFGPTSSSYYQALYLQQFLEQYAEAKKNPANAGWRLVFDIPKQNQSYVVTPMQFVWQQNANKPTQIMYQLQFKGWRRINLLERVQNPSPASAYTVTPGILQRIVNGITQAQLVCSSAIGLIGAVTSDVNGVFNVLKQTALFAKTLAGVAVAVSDLPTSITQDFNSAIQQYVSNNASTVSKAVTTGGGAAGVAAISANSTKNNGLSQSAVSGGQLGQSSASAQQVSNSSAIFGNPNANVDLLLQVPVSQLSLNTAQQKKLNSIVSSTSLTVAQLNANANSILALATQLADYFGAGSTVYNNLFSLTPPPTLIQPMTINQFLILDTLYEFVQNIYYLTATTQVTDLSVQNSLNFIAGLANQSQITFDIPNSKIYVPVPHGLDLEEIAARYLGDPTRWIEIATLNNLEEPYIDNDGFQLQLLSNAIGRQVVVSSDQNLYLGQTVILNSSTQVPVARHITNLTKLPNGSSFLITLDGEPNLQNFVTADGAYLQAYLPNTTNSQQKIFIPSDLPPPTYPGQLNIIPPSVAVNDPLTGLSGTDILLDESGDIVLNNYADFLVSYGLTNLIQALRILFTTTLNSWIIHPEYGLGVRPGTSVSDLNIKQLYEQINSQVTQDPRFAAVNSLQISVSPPNLTISLGVSLPGMQGNLPLSFSLAA